MSARLKERKKTGTKQLAVVYKSLEEVNFKQMNLDENKSPLFERDPGHYKSAQAK